MLYLPTPPERTRPRHPISLDVSQFYRHQDVVGATSTIADVIKELHPVPQNDALRWLCSLSAGILAEEGMKPRTQLHWARQLLPLEWCQKFESMMQTDGDLAGAIFHRRTIWLVLQLAVLSCSDSAPAMANEEVAKRLGRACFMASDVLTAIESEYQDSLPTGDVTEWMITVMVPMLDSAYARVDFDLVGRARLLWQEVPKCTNFQRELHSRSLPSFEDAVARAHGVSLSECLRFFAALYVRFLGHQLEPGSNPLLLDLANDEIGKAFGPAFCSKAIRMISQTPNELAARMLHARQSWAFDVTPIRERPLLEVVTGKYCCPDMTLFIRIFVDRIYYLLEDAYGKDNFRSLMGVLLECYIDQLIGEFAVTKGPGRTYLSSPRFEGTQDEAADGLLLWTNAAAFMEDKAGLLTTRQRLSGIPDEIIKGIESLALGAGGKKRKGVLQLASNIGRIVSGESRLSCEGDRFDLGSCTRFFPILVCLDEAMGVHAVQKWLQPHFEAALAKAEGDSGRVGPLMILTVRDIEQLAIAGQSISVERLLGEYAQHLTSQPKDFTGSFSRFLRDRFGSSIDWTNSPTFAAYRRVVEELMPLLKDTEPTNLHE